MYLSNHYQLEFRNLKKKEVNFYEYCKAYLCLFELGTVPLYT